MTDPNFDLIDPKHIIKPDKILYKRHKYKKKQKGIDK